MREFQREIHNKFPDFIPEGLQKWIADNSGKFNEVVKTAAEKFEKGIKNKLYAILEAKFGATWWKDSIPKDIQKSAAVASIDDEGEEPLSEFLHLIEYKKVISRHWEICKQIFADPGVKNNKDEQLKWFDQLNPIRNRQAHYRKITAENFEFIKSLNEWLPERLGIDSLNLSI